MDIKNKSGNILVFLVIFLSVIFSLNLVYSATTETIRVDINEKISSSSYFDYYSNVKTSHDNLIEDYNSENLVLYYPFNYNNISNKDDYSSNNYIFNESSAIVWNSLGCDANSGCYVFDGVNDYLEVLNSSSLQFISNYTISSWIKIDTFVAWRSYIGMPFDTGANEAGYYIGTSAVANEVGFYLKTSSMIADDWGSANTNTLNTGQWYHFVGTYDGVNIKFYVDGELVSIDAATGNMDYVPQPENLFIGRYKDDNEDFKFDGQIDEVRIYNKSLSSEEIKRIYSKSENSFSGQINISNMHASEPVYDVEVFVNSSNFTSTPYFSSGNTGYVINSSSSGFTLFVPELAIGDNTIFNYDIYPVNKFPILFNTTTPDTRVMSGTQFTLTDRITNVFENSLGQDGCLYNVSVSQNSLLMTGESSDRVKFDSASIAGSGAGDVVFAGDEYSYNWDVNSGGCFNVSDNFLISYDVKLPIDTAFTGEHDISNSTLSFTLLDVFSGVNIDKILGISDANISLEKEIINFSSAGFSDSNVTWNVNSSFFTSSQLSYELNKATLWVSQKNVSGIYADPNTVENDSVSSSSLVVDYSLNTTVDLSNPWVSNDWNFNFSGFDNPMVWFDVDFTLLDDGTQLKDSKSSESLSSSYLRGVSLINGYWLDINKSVTSVGTDSYNINIQVYNKGTLSTPTNSVVTIYDLIPSGFTLNGSISKSNPAFYDVAENNNPIAGDLSGNLVQWGILPTNLKNVSLDSGAGLGVNNSIIIRYNVSGVGDYNGLDVFITGLDPQKVEGAGGSSAIILIEEFLDEASNFWFGLVSLVLVGLILIV